MRPPIALLILLFVLPSAPHAQDLRIMLKITTDSLRPIRKATIALSTGNEAALAGATDSSGGAAFTVHSGTVYAADISATGFAPFTGSLAADTAHTTFSFPLKRSRALEGAVVKASRPLMRQEGDVTIVDPEPLAVASTSGYEVLEKTPGIVADADGNFFMTSSTPATVYINGREMKMSGADIAAMLKALPPNAIARIEILRTPSAKYDASGGGGIINIVLKKGVKIGLTGSATAGMQQGVYGNQTAGINLSYNNGERNAYLNLNVARRNSLEHITSTRIITADSLLSQDAGTVYRTDNLFIGYGAGRSFGAKWDFSYDGRINGSATDNHTENESLIRRQSVAAIATDNFSGTANGGHSWNIDQSVDVKYKMDTAGSEWTIAAGWNGVFGNNRQDILSRFALPARADILDNGDIATQRHYGSFQSDLKYKYRHGITFEAGIKATASFFRHNSDYTVLYRDSSIADPFRSTTYHYRENINAAYIQVSKEFAGITVKPGLRIENTNMDGEQTRPAGTPFGIHRTDLFPYLYISRRVMTIAKYELRAYLVYRKAILRPGYDYLNPFQRFVDQYLYEAGNPALRPQFTHNYEANISVEERPVLAVGYNDVKDIFANVVYESDLDKSIVARTWDNLGSNREFYLRGLGAIPPGGTYFFVFGGQYNVNMYDGYYNGAPLQYRRESFTFFTYHNLKLGKKTNIVVNGFMRLKGMQQFYELGAFGALNASVNRYFLDKKLLVTIAAQDLFFTNRYDATIDQGGINGTVSRYNDSQRFGTNVRYNFGIRAKREKKDFMGGDEAEKSIEP